MLKLTCTAALLCSSFSSALHVRGGDDRNTGGVTERDELDVQLQSHALGKVYGAGVALDNQFVYLAGSVGGILATISSYIQHLMNRSDTLSEFC